jgi:hypothetical protein
MQHALRLLSLPLAVPTRAALHCSIGHPRAKHLFHLDSTANIPYHQHAYLITYVQTTEAQMHYPDARLQSPCTLQVLTPTALLLAFFAHLP